MSSALYERFYNDRSSAFLRHHSKSSFDVEDVVGSLVSGNGATGGSEEEEELLKLQEGREGDDSEGVRLICEMLPQEVCREYQKVLKQRQEIDSRLKALQSRAEELCEIYHYQRVVVDDEKGLLRFLEEGDCIESENRSRIARPAQKKGAGAANRPASPLRQNGGSKASVQKHRIPTTAVSSPSSTNRNMAARSNGTPGRRSRVFSSDPQRKALPTTKTPPKQHRPSSSLALSKTSDPLVGGAAGTPPRRAGLTTGKMLSTAVSPHGVKNSSKTSLQQKRPFASVLSTKSNSANSAISTASLRKQQQTPNTGKELDHVPIAVRQREALSHCVSAEVDRALLGDNSSNLSAKENEHVALMSMGSPQPKKPALEEETSPGEVEFGHQEPFHSPTSHHHTHTGEATGHWHLERNTTREAKQPPDTDGYIDCKSPTPPTSHSAPRNSPSDDECIGAGPTEKTRKKSSHGKEKSNVSEVNVSSPEEAVSCRRRPEERTHHHGRRPLVSPPMCSPPPPPYSSAQPPFEEEEQEENIPLQPPSPPTLREAVNELECRAVSLEIGRPSGSPENDTGCYIPDKLKGRGHPHEEVHHFLEQQDQHGCLKTEAEREADVTSLVDDIYPNDSVSMCNVVPPSIPPTQRAVTTMMMVRTSVHHQPQLSSDGSCEREPVREKKEKHLLKRTAAPTAGIECTMQVPVPASSAGSVVSTAAQSAAGQRKKKKSRPTTFTFTPIQL